MSACLQEYKTWIKSVRESVAEGNIWINRAGKEENLKYFLLGAYYNIN
jgi:hypothetical protein